MCTLKYVMKNANLQSIVTKHTQLLNLNAIYSAGIGCWIAVLLLREILIEFNQN